MIKYKILSSLELLNVSKPRVALILKDLIDNLLYLVNNDYSENLHDFRNLCIQLKNKRIDDISSCISQNIIDYKIDFSSSNRRVTNIEFIFKNGFPINKLNIKDLTL